MKIALSFLRVHRHGAMQTVQHWNLDDKSGRKTKLRETKTWKIWKKIGERVPSTSTVTAQETKYHDDTYQWQQHTSSSGTSQPGKPPLLVDS